MNTLAELEQASERLPRSAESYSPTHCANRATHETIILTIYNVLYIIFAKLLIIISISYNKFLRQTYTVIKTTTYDVQQFQG